jgi:iron complex outermembrane receptor protein
MKRRHLGKSALSALLLAVLAEPLPAKDSDSPGLTEDYFFGEIPVVLSASRLAQPVSESPAAMTIIDRELIEASGAINIPDVLRLVPGFQVSHISGANLTAQYHGLADKHPKRMQVLIDGRSVYHSAFGGVHWDSLPITLDDVERIEVLRGSNAAAYGSNAFMGVVNIVTRHASQDRGSQISLLGGYNGTRMAEYRFGDRLGNLNYRFSVSKTETDGFPNYRWRHIYWDSTGPGASASSIKTGDPYVEESNMYELARNDSQSIGRLDLRGDYLMDNGDSLLFELGYVRNNRDNSLVNGDFEKLRPDQKLDTNTQLLKWSRQTPDLGDVSLQLSHNRLDFDSRYIDTLIIRTDDPGFCGGPITPPTIGCLVNAGPTQGGYTFQNDRYDLELQQTVPKTGGWRIVWGMGARLDRLSSDNFVSGSGQVDRAQYRLFGNTEKHFGGDEQWVFNAGLMLEHQQDIGDYASPRLALSYHVDPFNTLRIAVSRAYRMPSFAEQYSESGWDLLDPSSINPVFSNPLRYLIYSNQSSDIKPERLSTIELGLVSASWLNGLSFDIRLFHEELRNYIDEVLHQDACTGCDSISTTPGLGYNPHDLWMYENAGWLDLDGIELQTRYDLSDRTTFAAAASIVDAKGQRTRTRNSSGAVVASQDISDFVPERTYSALLSHRFSAGWSASIGYYRMGKMNWPNDGDRIDPYERFDVRLAKKLRIGGDKAQIELIGQNIRNHEYNEFLADNYFERRLYVRFKLETE